MNFTSSVQRPGIPSQEHTKNPAQPLECDESSPLRVDSICEKKPNLSGGDRVSSFLIKDILDEKKHGSDVTFTTRYATDDCFLQEGGIRSEEQELSERTPSVSCDSDSQRGEWCVT